MTHKENITAILECYFTGFKKEIIDSACNRILEQERCEDNISRQAVLDMIEDINGETGGVGFYYEHYVEYIKALPSVTPKEKIGRWICDKNIENWRCSECNETPKTMGYVGTADFMAEHFKYCNHCGARMQEVEE